MEHKDINPDPSQPLENVQWELFCQHYAGDCYGRYGEAYIAAGYSSRDNANASASASRLAKRQEISSRIKFLREQKLKELEIDQLWIAEQRKYIAEHAEKEIDRLRALKDLEKGLGLLPLNHKEDGHPQEEIKIVFNGRPEECQ